MIRRPPNPTLFPYPTLFRSRIDSGTLQPLPVLLDPEAALREAVRARPPQRPLLDEPAVDEDEDDRREEPGDRSEEHTSELQSQSNLVCRLLLEKKKKPTRLVQRIAEETICLSRTVR